METVYIAIFFIVLCSLYITTSFYNKNRDKVIFVETGSVANVDEAELKIKRSVPPKIFRLPDGTYASSHKFIRIIVKGSCMSKKGICSGEEWLVEAVNRHEKLENQIRPGNVLLIYLEDKGIYKIREFKSFTAREELMTLYYDKDGLEHLSSKPHSVKSVVGIVKYGI